MAMLSLKRIVKLDCTKSTLILEENCKEKIKTLNFGDDLFNEISCVCNSTNNDCEEENEVNEDEMEVDDEYFIARTMAKLNQVKPNEEGLKGFSDWEDMLLFGCTKYKRR
jgi:hypothetical protein